MVATAKKKVVRKPIRTQNKLEYCIQANYERQYKFFLIECFRYALIMPYKVRHNKMVLEGNLLQCFIAHLQSTLYGLDLVENIWTVRDQCAKR